ncbi:MAG: PEP-CTERM sorting domain-containing protein [Cyanobacteriota bacterium]|nr:PEP-CTERM sorting domain-containing protein [Cyanobacteriota bacterium]
MASLTFVKKVLMAASATVMTLVSGQAAQAITFEFGGFDLDSSLSFSEEGVDVTATGFTPNGVRFVSQTPNGLGVFGVAENVGGIIVPDAFQTDGLGPDETLELAFSQQISLVSATFGRVGSNDEFRLLVDGDELVSADIPGGNANFLSTDTGTFDFTIFEVDERTGSVLGFTVTDANDSYFLSSIEVEPVPEPLTILGSLSALGMGTVLKKRQKKS